VCHKVAVFARLNDDLDVHGFEITIPAELLGSCKSSTSLREKSIIAPAMKCFVY